MINVIIIVAVRELMINVTVIEAVRELSSLRAKGIKNIPAKQSSCDYAHFFWIASLYL